VFRGKQQRYPSKWWRVDEGWNYVLLSQVPPERSSGKCWNKSGGQEAGEGKAAEPDGQKTPSVDSKGQRLRITVPSKDGTVKSWTLTNAPQL
jgi:hypothetical protein